MSKQKVLVFGGSGFLGYYLVEELKKNGYEIYVADLRSSGQKEVHFLACDIIDRQNVLSVAKLQAFDFIYNLAGFANLDDASEQAYATIQSNVIGNINILDACLSTKVKRYIYASSAYAMNNKGSFYGISKLTSEKIIEEYHLKYNLTFTILRYGSVYSEKKYHNNYIFKLVEEAIKTRKIIHDGDGEEIREYIHAADAASLSVKILSDEQYANQHIILTGGERMKRIDLFNMINEILNDSLNIELKDTAYPHHYKYTPYSYQALMSKKLTANPFVDLGQGILECIRTIKNGE
jgi:UDP-glucose 4-epimerase